MYHPIYLYPHVNRNKRDKTRHDSIISPSLSDSRHHFIRFSRDLINHNHTLKDLSIVLNRPVIVPQERVLPFDTDHFKLINGHRLFQLLQVSLLCPSSSTSFLQIKHFCSVSNVREPSETHEPITQRVEPFELKHFIKRDGKKLVYFLVEQGSA